MLRNQLHWNDIRFANECVYYMLVVLSTSAQIALFYGFKVVSAEAQKAVSVSPISTFIIAATCELYNEKEAENIVISTFCVIRYFDLYEVNGSKSVFQYEHNKSCVELDWGWSNKKLRVPRNSHNNEPLYNSVTKPMTQSIQFSRNRKYFHSKWSHSSCSIQCKGRDVCCELAYFYTTQPVDTINWTMFTFRWRINNAAN